MKSIIEYPQSWKKPEKPAFGSFPFPFRNASSNPTKLMEASQAAITHALEVGYRHIDTAFTYNNQDQIGNAVAEAGLRRDEIFVTSKLHPYNNSFKEAKQKLGEAIRLIWGGGVGNKDNYLDSFLIHYPGYGNPTRAYMAMQEARSSGYVRHIGVSNFEIHHLGKLKEETGEYPDVNQIEFHPWIYKEQAELIRFCRLNNIALEGYSSLAQGKCLDEPLVKRIASKHTTSPVRIILKWSMQHCVLPIFGSRKADHIKSNFDPYDFELTEEEVNDLNNLGDKHLITVAEQWNWNPKEAPYGGLQPPKRDPRYRSFFQNYIKKVFSNR